MIFLINADNRSQFAADLAAMHRQRKIVFADRAGWNVPVTADQEIDRYDRHDTIYLLAKDEPSGPILASLRLLPTERAHLMSELFPISCLAAIPRGPRVWEVWLYRIPSG
jgi:N-acyl-L-homoserine lactone synthetase